MCYVNTGNIESNKWVSYISNILFDVICKVYDFIYSSPVQTLEKLNFCYCLLLMSFSSNVEKIELNLILFHSSSQT